MDDSPLYLSLWALSSSQTLTHNVCPSCFRYCSQLCVLIEVVQSIILTDQTCLVCLHCYWCFENASWGAILEKWITWICTTSEQKHPCYLRKLVCDNLFCCPQAARKRKISILKAQGKSTEAIRELNEYLEQWVFLWDLSPLPLILTLLLHFHSLYCRLKFRKWIWCLCLQVCWGPGSMARVVRALHQWTWVNNFFISDSVFF